MMLMFFSTVMAVVCCSHVEGWSWKGTDWSWDRLNVATWGQNEGTGVENSTIIKFKERFDVSEP